VLPPAEDIETWLNFASLCRKSGRISQARSTLVKLLQVCTLHLVYDGFFLMLPLFCVPYSIYFRSQYDPEITPENVQYHGPPQVMLAYLKFQWSLGEDSKRREAFSRLQVSYFPLV